MFDKSISFLLKSFEMQCIIRLEKRMEKEHDSFLSKDSLSYEELNRARYVEDVLISIDKDMFIVFSKPENHFGNC